jgi:hypothetical protein
LTTKSQDKSFTNKNGKFTNKGPWDGLGIKRGEPFKINVTNVQVQKEMSKTMDNFGKGFRRGTNKIYIEPRFDQTDKPVYPSFETEHKGKVLSNNGWGLNNKKLKYKTAHPQKG